MVCSFLIVPIRTDSSLRRCDLLLLLLLSTILSSISELSRWNPRHETFFIGVGCQGNLSLRGRTVWLSMPIVGLRFTLRISYSIPVTMEAITDAAQGLEAFSLFSGSL